MNRRLADPFQTVELPEHIEEYLDHGTATCTAFNRRGTLLAAGTSNGNLVVWDFDTRGVARVYAGHESPISAVQWSHNGRYIVSGGGDKSLILWNVLTGEQEVNLPLPAAVQHLSLAPSPPYRCIVSLAERPPVLVDLSSGSDPRTLSLPGEARGKDATAAAGSAASGEPNGANAGGCIAIFDKRAELVLVGHGKGTITVLDAVTLAVVDVVRLPGQARVQALCLNRKGDLLLVTCQDRTIRLYSVRAKADVPAPAAGADPVRLQAAIASAAKVRSGSLLHSGDAGVLCHVRDFQNAVDRTLWRCAVFSADDEHVVGAREARNEHHLYVWNRHYGNMERMLEGPKEGVRALTWHPQRSILLSVSTTGRIYVWAKIYSENWSAFAPDFKELEDNTEYVEREDEFDWNTPGFGEDGEQGGAGAATVGSSANADDDVDILTIPADAQLLSGSDSDAEAEGVGASGGRAGYGDGQERGSLHYLPVEVVAEDEPATRQADDDDDDDGGGDGDGDGPVAAAGVGAAASDGNAGAGGEARRRGLGQRRSTAAAAAASRDDDGDEVMRDRGDASVQGGGASDGDVPRDGGVSSIKGEAEGGRGHGDDGNGGVEDTAAGSAGGMEQEDGGTDSGGAEDAALVMVPGLHDFKYDQGGDNGGSVNDGSMGNGPDANGGGDDGGWGQDDTQLGREQGARKRKAVKFAE